MNASATLLRIQKEVNNLIFLYITIYIIVAIPHINVHNGMKYRSIQHASMAQPTGWQSVHVIT
jgi:hypothetical protein